MTRKEQVKEYLLAIGNGDMKVTPFDVGFECGVEWADAHPHWISVEDELPPTQEDVLVCRKDGETRVAWLANRTWRTIDGYPLNDNITHWMPLPAPPEHIADVSKKIGSSEKPSTCKKFDIPGYENVVIHEGNAKGGILKGGEQ